MGPTTLYSSTAAVLLIQHGGTNRTTRLHQVDVGAAPYREFFEGEISKQVALRHVGPDGELGPWEAITLTKKGSANFSFDPSAIQRRIIDLDHAHILMFVRLASHQFHYRCFTQADGQFPIVRAQLEGRRTATQPRPMVIVAELVAVWPTCPFWKVTDMSLP